MSDAQHTIDLRRKSDNTCDISENATVTEPDELDLVLTPTPSSCFGANNGSISAAVTGSPLNDLQIQIG